MRKFAIAVLFFLVPEIFAANPPCNPEQKQTNCTVAEAKEFYRNAAAAQALSAATAAVTKMATSDVANTNRPTTPPETFAGRLHNSYQDYLNLFAFGINKVEESGNGQALTVRFNPFREGTILAGGSVTAAEPVVADVVKNLVPEDQRDAAVTMLKSKMGNTDDLTWAISASLATNKCPVTAEQRCWGRSPRAYRDITSAILEPLNPSIPDDLLDLQDQLQALFPPARNIDFETRHLSEITSESKFKTALDLIRRQVGAEAASVKITQELFKANHLDLLPTLIDNQPQLSFTGTYHNTGQFEGPPDHTISVEMHFGRQNLNTMRAACADDPDKSTCFKKELDAYAAAGLTTDKFVLTATLKRTDAYILTSLPLDPPVSFEPVDLPSGSEFHLKAQAGRQLTMDPQQPNTQATRVDASVEIVRNRNGQFFTQNRMILTATIDVPFMNFTVPVSIKYANKPEFLGDVQNRIGVHVGLSYRLPMLPAMK